MVCKKCGKENDDNMKFCGECGANLLEVVSEETESPMENSLNISAETTAEVKPKKKKRKIWIILIVLIALGISFFALFGTGGKINGVSRDTYQECTRIMKIISTERYINETANEVENVLYQKYGSDWSSIPIGELHDYVLENSDALNLFFSDIENIPMTTENDKILVKFVLCQYAFVIEESLNRGNCGTAFPFTAVLYEDVYGDVYGYDYSFEEYQDIYRTFILKYIYIYDNANDVEDIKKEIDEMSVLAKCTTLLDHS